MPFAPDNSVGVLLSLCPFLEPGEGIIFFAE